MSPEYYFIIKADLVDNESAQNLRSSLLKKKGMRSIDILTPISESDQYEEPALLSQGIEHSISCVNEGITKNEIRRNITGARGRRLRIPIINLQGEVPLHVRIRTYRIFKGISMNEMAEAAGCKANYISHLELHPVKEIHPSIIQAIYDKLETSEDSLLAASREEINDWIQINSA